MLAENQITVPELGVIRAEAPPIVLITSNRTREIHDALKRRCFYHWVDFPDLKRELETSAQVQSKKELYVEAAKDLPYGIVVTAMAVP